METNLTGATKYLSERAESIAAQASWLPGRVTELVALAGRGLAQMHHDNGRAFAQTARGLLTPAGSVLNAGGENVRYSGMAALGLAQLTIADQKSVLGGSTAADLVAETAKRASGRHDPGAIAMACWASAEVSTTFEAGLFDQLVKRVDAGSPLPTVDAAWILTATIAAQNLGDTTVLRERIADLLAENQDGGGLYPHVLPGRAAGKFRRHIGSFADQVYPLQAFARLAGAIGDRNALKRANRTAETLCRLQGSAGQWWWHYDSRTGDIIERFPVYSVHQHAMAPMVLFDLRDAGGRDFGAEIARGLDWLHTHPEVMDEIVSPAHGVIWRKVGRREPPKAVRSVSAVTTSVRSGLHLPGLDNAFPATRIDYECRPYELGWLLYAWLRSSSQTHETRGER